MVTSKRLEKNYETLNKFLENNSQYKELADIFNKFLHKNNEHKCEISVGKNYGGCFQKYLSAVARNYNVILSNHKSEPQYIIREYNGGNTLAMFNLALIKNVHINIVKNNDGSIFSYEINFTYNQHEHNVDYHMCFCN